MIERIKKLLGIRPAVDYRKLVQEGAQIIDVRTEGEYASGHIQGSINIPLQDILKRCNRFSKDQPIIVCCASGMRSGSAENILSAKGFTKVYNGGGWISLLNRIR